MVTRLVLVRQSLRRRGSGKLEVDAAKIRNIEWTFEPGTAFDLWLDDVSFFR